VLLFEVGTVEEALLGHQEEDERGHDRLEARERAQRETPLETEQEPVADAGGGRDGEPARHRDEARRDHHQGEERPEQKGGHALGRDHIRCSTECATENVRFARAGGPLRRRKRDGWMLRRRALPTAVAVDIPSAVAPAQSVCYCAGPCEDGCDGGEADGGALT